MDWTTLATRLFGADHGIRADGDFLHGPSASTARRSK